MAAMSFHSFRYFSILLGMIENQQQAGRQAIEVERPYHMPQFVAYDATKVEAIPLISATLPTLLRTILHRVRLNYLLQTSCTQKVLSFSFYISLLKEFRCTFLRKSMDCGEKALDRSATRNYALNAMPRTP